MWDLSESSLLGLSIERGSHRREEAMRSKRKSSTLFKANLSYVIVGYTTNKEPNTKNIRDITIDAYFISTHNI